MHSRKKILDLKFKAKPQRRSYKKERSIRSSYQNCDFENYDKERGSMPLNNIIPNKLIFILKLFYIFDNLQAMASTCAMQSSSCKTLLSRKSFHTVVLLRHGESIWNKENRFTGWCDVPLTEKGKLDAHDAGHILRDMKFDIAFTSELQRAWKTCDFALSTGGLVSTPIAKSWKLNERHYGGLQGHLKSCPKLLEVFGEDKLKRWRRSYSTRPPNFMDDGSLIELMKNDEVSQLISHLDISSLDESTRFWLQNRNSAYTEGKPFGESLEQCEHRVSEFWTDEIAPQVRMGKAVLVVAHANTIRMLVKSLENISDDQASYLKIPNGIPLVYTLDQKLKPVDVPKHVGFQAKYLVSSRNELKMKEYQQSVQKNLMGVFEYLSESTQFGAVQQMAC